MYKPRFTDFTSDLRSNSHYRALGEKVAQRHPHFVILILPSGKQVPVKFLDNWDLLSWCDLFWERFADEGKTATIRVPEFDDIAIPEHLELESADIIGDL